MYDPDTLKKALRDRRFKNDTVGEAFPQGKRLEKLFKLYTKMPHQQTTPKKPTSPAAPKTS